MGHWFSTIDKLLRGDYTTQDELSEGRISLSIPSLLLYTLVFGAIYGVFMGLHAALRAGLPPDAAPGTLGGPEPMQIVASMLKLPLLFILTLAVTYPSLYVYSALAGSRLRFLDTLRLLLAGMVVNLALAASFGPITGFFTLSTDSYPFMIVLNVFFLAAGGYAGLSFIYKAVKLVTRPLTETKSPPPTPTPAPPQKPPEDKPGEKETQESATPKPAKSESGSDVPAAVKKAWPPAPAAALPDPEAKARVIFGIWAFLYGAVGAQMGWILRPFIGSPGKPFEWFRERESNFFEAFIRSIGQLFSGS